MSLSTASWSKVGVSMLMCIRVFTSDRR
jgi:hypothetical protein